MSIWRAKCRRAGLLATVSLMKLNLNVHGSLFNGRVSTLEFDHENFLPIAIFTPIGPLFQAEQRAQFMKIKHR